jgi:ABC-type nitrate/sulfonate/bicarbonate transport system permease component
VLAGLGLALFGAVVWLERLLIPWHVSQRVAPDAH